MDTELLQRKLRVLHLEDNEHDHILVAETLTADGLQCEFVLAKSKPEFLEALAAGNFDLIISDFSLPSYDGLTALSAAQATKAETPFVFFSGTIGEEVAVESLRQGASDYILKQRPSRLTAAVRRALRNAQERAKLRKAEQALRQSEERLRIIARATNDIVWEWDTELDQIWFSENFSAAFGHEIEVGLSSEKWFGFLHPDDKERVVASLCALLAAGGRIWWSEHRFRRGNGSYAHIFDRASVVYDDRSKPVRLVGLKIDVTERKQAEEKIRQQAALLDKTRDAIIVCQLDRRIVFWNLGAERIYGWSAADAMDQSVDELLSRDDSPAPDPEMIKSLEERGEWMGELSQITREGKAVTVRSRCTIVRDDDQAAKSLLIINTDITEHKQLEEQFLRAQRLESLGALVSGIAHDLNNALVPIMMGVEILQSENLSEHAAGMVMTMGTSVRRSADMVRQMLMFARGGEASKVYLQPDRLLKEIGKVITDTFPKNIRCRIEFGRNLALIYCVPTQIFQVLMNLCVNARDAMPEGGSVTLAAENISISETEARSIPEARAGDFVCIRVTDTGTGITPEQLAKLFQPFFTTKAPGKGTGLGLSTCRGIISKHDGFITVRSQLQAGSEFRVYLPAFAEKSEEAPPPAATAPPAGKGERILVVDDEEGILAITRAALENYGYAVSTASSGLEALTCFRENADAIRLVITDHSLPFIGVKALIAALRKFQPAVKILVASGSEDEAEETLRGTQTDGFIAKPFSTEKLLKIVHEVLNQEK
jgi:PAS domain S-box-containing protein